MKVASYDRLVLASASPRRRDLLHQVRLPHQVYVSNVPELHQAGESPEVFVRRLAHAKAIAAQRAYAHRLSGNRYWFIGADTVVLLNAQIIGKPESLDQARTYLQQLQGRRHTVLSGFSVLCPKKQLCEAGVDLSEVSLAPLTESEIDLYLSFRDWEDAAGAYKIQGTAAAFVQSVQGSFPNVMGLPIHKICSILRSNQFRVGT